MYAALGRGKTHLAAGGKALGASGGTTQIFLHSGIDHVQNTVPFFCLIVPYRLTAVSVQKTDELVAVDPDFSVSFFLGFVKNKLNTKMQMGSIDIVGIFFRAVSGPSHVSDDVSGRDHASLLQAQTVREILPQMCIIIITSAVKTADAEPPAAVLIPADCFHIAGFHGDDRRAGINKILNKSKGNCQGFPVQRTDLYNLFNQFIFLPVGQRIKIF